VAFDTKAIRRQFPILERRIRTLDGQDRPLVYLDHGASTHAPTPVIDAVDRMLKQQYANIHRGNHTLSVEASELFDHATESFARFLGARSDDQVIVLGQNTTMALDIAAHVMGAKKGVTLTSAGEHHSNDLPHRRRGKVLHAEVDDQGRLLLDDVQRKLDKNPVKLLAITGASNVTGHMPDVHKLARMAHDANAKILVDAAQLYAHAPIDVKAPDHPEHLDFVAAAGHKSYAPLGSAFLLGPRDLLDDAEPYMPGGGTVDWVTDDSVLFAKSPDRHMGGTPNIVGAIAFAAATAFLQDVGMTNVRQHEEELLAHGLKRFRELEDHGVQLLGPKKASEKVGVFTFLVPDVRHELVSAILNHEHGIATRNGCFCAHPLLHRLLGLGDTTKWRDALKRGETIDLPGATRGTLGIYNTKEEVDRLCDAVGLIAQGKWKGKYDMIDSKSCRPRDEGPQAVAKAARKAKAVAPKA
jgi:selenocysteine lyase/cysteine desulfurase